MHIKLFLFTSQALSWPNKISQLFKLWYIWKTLFRKSQKICALHTMINLRGLCLDFWPPKRRRLLSISAEEEACKQLKLCIWNSFQCKMFGINSGACRRGWEVEQSLREGSKGTLTTAKRFFEGKPEAVGQRFAWGKSWGSLLTMPEGVVRVYMDPPVGNVLPPTTWGLSTA